VLPTLAGIIPVKAELRELAANLLGGLLGEGDPNPLADNLGEVVHLGEPLAEKVENLLGSESAIFFALLVVDIRENPGGFLRLLRSGGGCGVRAALAIGLRCCVGVSAQLLRTAQEP